MLQLIHAGKDPHVRELKTLPALDRLAEGHYLAVEDRDSLHGAYRFLRQVEHKIQIVHDRQTHSLPDTEAEIRVLARRLRVEDWGEGKRQKAEGKSQRAKGKGQNSPLPDDEAALFRSLFHTHSEAVHQIFCSLFYAPQEQQADDPHAEAVQAFFEALDDRDRGRRVAAPVRLS